MNQAEIKAIEQFVNVQRKALRAEVEAQLHDYGIQASGELLPESSLEHLPDEDHQTADQLRQRLLHLSASMKPAAAFKTISREQAFTILNRMVALRMAEARGVVLEAVARGMESEGFQLYLQSCGKSGGEQYDWYRQYILTLYDELSLELPVLFDRFRGEGLIFPRQAVLTGLIESMALPQMERAWEQDETIGWIYQYFNDPKERKKMREKSAPSDSYELAVRNQFFTPRYVVRFLVDNSLGRLWREMTKDRTVLQEQCSMMALSPDDELRYIAPREPRELKIIDPACGSMHFGLYTFDVLSAIYLDAWEKGSAYPWCKEFQDSYIDRTELIKAIPNLICAHNIFGIDIDPRAVQIAGMTLWLRSHRFWHEEGLPAELRPQILRFNLATAQPMPGEKEFFEEFVSTLSPKPLQKIASIVWEELKLAGDVGSLLKVESTIDAQAEKIRTLLEKVPTAEQKQNWLLSEEHADYSMRRYGVDLSEVAQEDEWAEMEERVFEALKQFAASHRSKAYSYQRSLFADDTLAGFAFLDVLRNSFDVVVMNPPFGASAARGKKYIEKRYPRTKNDLYAAFVEGFLHRLKIGGYLAAITSRTGFFLSSFTKWREEILLEEAEPVVLADLGFGVLDAMVETAAYVIRRAV